MVFGVRVEVLEVVVEDEAGDHVGRHADLDGGCAGRVGVEDRADVRLGKVEAVLEEERADEGELLELGQGDGPRADELPLGRHGEEFVNELVRVR